MPFLRYVFPQQCVTKFLSRLFVVFSLNCVASCFYRRKIHYINGGKSCITDPLAEFYTHGSFKMRRPLLLPSLCSITSVSVFGCISATLARLKKREKFLLNNFMQVFNIGTLFSCSVSGNYSIFKVSLPKQQIHAGKEISVMARCLSF